MADGSYGFATLFGGSMILDVADEILKAIKSRAAIAAAEGE